MGTNYAFRVVSLFRSTWLFCSVESKQEVTKIMKMLAIGDSVHEMSNSAFFEKLTYFLCITKI